MSLSTEDLSRAAAAVSRGFPGCRVSAGDFPVPDDPSLTHVLCVLDLPEKRLWEAFKKAMRILDRTIGEDQANHFTVFAYEPARSEENLPTDRPGWLGFHIRMLFQNGVRVAAIPRPRTPKTSRRSANGAPKRRAARSTVRAGVRRRGVG
jgi:hypothetical protein